MQTAMAQNAHASIFETARAWWEDWKLRQHDLAELRSMGEGSIEKLAADVGVSPYELFMAAASGEHAADEMLLMMQAFNIDPAAVSLDNPDFFRFMQSNCAACQDKKACRHDLADGTASEHYNDYCRNAEILSELRAKPEMLAF